ncbi:hypothetical protein KO481_38740 [Nocardia sp. NEAU-G5]|uniref:Uncharacterized protein n=1 Tax=Nocardia albiluteola TaxID=2842303 RepID=A0ABS6BBC1_9NOCA|nr:hypothetical protein [Nocardia albiluteola]MBU3067448.1 hypothetical protein [Nocardia albiluteola]
MTAMEEARRWLAAEGVVQVDEDVWLAESRQLSPNDVAHEWAGAMLGDPDLDESGRLRLGFGLLDLVDEYWVTCEIGFLIAHTTDPLVHQVLWREYRSRLEAPEATEAIDYSLWVHWFEDRTTVETAFAQVLGDDTGKLHSGDAALLRRAQRVLEISGPVPWTLKEPVYLTAVEVPELQRALFRGLLTSYHDVYGDLEPEPALRLLARLPPDVEHFDTLCAVLRAGHRKHYLSPEAWTSAAGDTK